MTQAAEEKQSAGEKSFAALPDALAKVKLGKEVIYTDSMDVDHLAKIVVDQPHPDGRVNLIEFARHQGDEPCRFIQDVRYSQGKTAGTWRHL